MARAGAWPVGLYGLVALSGKVIEHAFGYRAPAGRGGGGGPVAGTAC